MNQQVEASMCQHLITTREEIQTIGDTISLVKKDCAIKMRSRMDLLKVYSALFKKGLEGSMLTNCCPVADREAWSECPFSSH